MQQWRSGVGSHKHGVSGHASQSPRLRLFKKLAAERGEYQAKSARAARPLQFETVGEALKAERKPRSRRT